MEASRKKKQRNITLLLYSIQLKPIPNQVIQFNLDEKDNASLYCGLTLKRQLESNSYELKDFVVNCISLNEYYTNTKNYSQAYYLLQCALSIIPEDKKKKLRATGQMSLGRMFSDMLQYNVTLMLEN